MTVRTAHGAGAASALLRVETLPIDELPAGVAGFKHVPSTTERQAKGRFAKGACTLQREGGKARAGKTTLAEKLGLSRALEAPEFAPYRKAADDFKRAQIRDLARSVGGGVCGPAPSSIIASAALQLAASRFAYDQGRHELGSKLSNDSRQNLLAAHELCAREAKGRPTPTDEMWAGMVEKKPGAKK